MIDSDKRFWPFKPKLSVVSAIVLLVGLLLLEGLLQVQFGWPGENSEITVILGIYTISLLPVALALLDIVIERGGVIEIRDIKIAFSQASQLRMKNFELPADLGLRGEPVTDSSTTQIIDALRGATSCDAAIVDLEEGHAWWESRLLVLLAGAERLKKPAKIVFVATDKGKQQQFKGWAHSNDLLWSLVQTNPQYLRSLHVARAAARQWELVEPANPVDPAQPGITPIQPPLITGELATQYPWMAFDAATGLPNELLAEQLLATDLGQKIEMQGGSISIDLSRLNELFKPLLVTDRLDLSSSTERQISSVFDCERTYIAVTEKERYSTLIAKADVMNQMLRGLVEKKKA